MSTNIALGTVGGNRRRLGFGELKRASLKEGPQRFSVYTISIWNEINMVPQSLVTPNGRERLRHTTDLVFAV